MGCRESGGGGGKSRKVEGSSHLHLGGGGRGIATHSNQSINIEQKSPAFMRSTNMGHTLGLLGSWEGPGVTSTSASASTSTSKGIQVSQDQPGEITGVRRWELYLKLDLYS